MKLLQNKLFVGCLAAGAFGLLGWDLLSPHLAKPTPAVTTIGNANKPSPAVKELEALLPPRLLKITDGLKNYVQQLDSLESTARDPSAYPVPATTRLEPGTNSPPPPPRPASTKLVLKAISLNGERGLAVLNHQVVAVGDKIGGYEVERIDSTSVWLKNELGTITLTLAKSDSTQATPTSGNLSKADEPSVGRMPAAAVGLP